MSQPKMEGLDSHTIYFLGLALLGWGLVFVLSSFYALGFTGTFLGKTRRYGMTVGRFTGVQEEQSPVAAVCYLWHALRITGGGSPLITARTFSFVRSSDSGHQAAP